MLCVEPLLARIRACGRKRFRADCPPPPGAQLAARRCAQGDRAHRSASPRHISDREIAAQPRTARDVPHGSICRQTRGLAEADDRTVGLVYEKIAALEQIPEDANWGLPSRSRFR